MANPDRVGSASSAENSLQWNRTDTVLLGVLAAVAIATRFWRLGYPSEPIFDELQFVGQSLAYLRGEQFLDPHPPLAKLLVAVSVSLFGAHPWSWRFPSACLGSGLVVVSYLLGRELFRNRFSALMCAALVLCDGMFLIHSRLAMLEIFHVTFTAISYLLLFQFMRLPKPWLARGKIVSIGIFSGFALASKLLIPAVGFLLVGGFMVYRLVSEPGVAKGKLPRIIFGTGALITSVSLLVYLGAFLPHFWLGWWGGAGAIVHYYSEVSWLLSEMADSASNFVSPWWSWPLMLRAPAYWRSVVGGEQMAAIWEGGNPVLWWGALSALAIGVVTAINRPSRERSFLAIGYLAFMLALAPARHPFFLYIYMAPLYLTYLMLAGLLGEFWSGEGSVWEHVVVLLSLVPDCILGLGVMPAIIVFLILILGYAIVAWRSEYGGRYVCFTFNAAAIAVFAYFLPLWFAIPLEPASFAARIWLNGPGIAKWM
jgi:dolichyl-phosphate-mannose-protein mannosyltransferase